MHAPPSTDPATAAAFIDAKIAALPDWRGQTLARVRHLILAADPAVVEEVKWRGVPVWSVNGILTTGEVYKTVVKLTFAHGASLPDPDGLFNSSLEGNVRRAIDLRKGELLDALAFTALVRAAIERNRTPKPRSGTARTQASATKKTTATRHASAKKPK